MNVTTIGLDPAKNVFQVHGIDDAGNGIVRRSLRRRQVMPYFAKLAPCLIGMEACGTSHYWARELKALAGDQRTFTTGADNARYVIVQMAGVAVPRALFEQIVAPIARLTPLRDTG